MRKNSVYTIHPSFAMEESALAILKERTRHTIEEWVRVVRKSGPATEKERIAWLKEAHGITTNYALWIARRVDGDGSAAPYDPDAMVEAMFAGKKRCCVRSTIACWSWHSRSARTCASRPARPLCRFIASTFSRR